MRYSCDWRGLMRVKVLSALINSVSKLIFQAGKGLAQMRRRQSIRWQSFAGVELDGLWSCEGERAVAVGRQPSGHAVLCAVPTIGIVRKKTSEIASKSLSLIARWR